MLPSEHPETCGTISALGPNHLGADCRLFTDHTLGTTGVFFPQDLAISEMSDSLLLSINVLSTQRTLRSPKVHLVLMVSSQISLGTPPFHTELEEEDSGKDLALESPFTSIEAPSRSLW